MFVTVLCCIFEDWSWIFRTRSFTLCRNDQDFNDMSDSATVLESTSSSSTINLTVCRANKPGGCSLTGLPVLTLPSILQISTLEKTHSCHHSTLSILMSKRSKQISLFFDAAHSMSSEVIDNLQFMSSTSVHSTATMRYWMKKTTNATFGIDKKDLV